LTPREEVTVQLAEALRHDLEHVTILGVTANGKLVFLTTRGTSDMRRDVDDARALLGVADA